MQARMGRYPQEIDGEIGMLHQGGRVGTKLDCLHWLYFLLYCSYSYSLDTRCTSTYSTLLPSLGLEKQPSYSTTFTTWPIIESKE